MSRSRAATLLVASIPLAFLVGFVSPVGELGLLVVLGVFVWIARTNRGFGATVLRGALSGAIAGILILGIGLRLAMRIVAITDSTRTPEFTAEGTAFILVGLGLMLGTFSGAYLGGLRHILGLGKRTIAIVGTIALVPLLFGDSETQAELLELGFGGWINIPMFTSIVFAYSWTQAGIAARLDQRAAQKREALDVTEVVPVP